MFVHRPKTPSTPTKTPPTLTCTPPTPPVATEAVDPVVVLAGTVELAKLVVDLDVSEATEVVVDSPSLLPIDP
jgi:hypothetical protein